MYICSVNVISGTLTMGYITSYHSCRRESGAAIILVEDASGPGWGPPPQDGATVFQATFNMVSRCLSTSNQKPRVQSYIFIAVLMWTLHGR